MLASRRERVGSPAGLPSSITTKKTPAAGSLRSAAVGPQPLLSGIGPVPIAHKTLGPSSPGSALTLTCHAAGVSIQSPLAPGPSRWRIHPRGGGGDRWCAAGEAGHCSQPLAG